VNGTPSRCNADCQAWKSGSVVEVPSSNTLRSMRGVGEADARAGSDIAPATMVATVAPNIVRRRMYPRDPVADRAASLRERQKLVIIGNLQDFDEPVLSFPKRRAR
jgi:hypothetical protein